MAGAELFTWNNDQDVEDRIACKLDRALVKEAWLDIFPHAFVSLGNSIKSDHAPLFVEMQRKKLRRRPFHFINHWSTWEGFDTVVDEAWNKTVRENPLYVFAKKLENMKQALRKWAKEKVNVPTLLKENRKEYEQVSCKLRKER